MMLIERIADDMSDCLCAHEKSVDCVQGAIGVYTPELIQQVDEYSSNLGDSFRLELRRQFVAELNG
jgi:hypothetical protein